MSWNVDLFLTSITVDLQNDWDFVLSYGNVLRKLINDGGNNLIKRKVAVVAYSNVVSQESVLKPFILLLLVVISCC